MLARQVETLQEFIAPDQIFIEYEGTGPSLDGDGYIRRAVDFHDSGGENGAAGAPRGGEEREANRATVLLVRGHVHRG